MNEFEMMSRLKSKRQKKRLVKESFHKKLLRLDKARQRLWNERSSIPLVELEKPFQKGYKRFFILREDVARSNRADFFEKLLEKINTIQYSDNRKFQKRKRKNRKKVWVNREQLLHNISEYDWITNKLKMTEDERSYFIRIEKYSTACKSKIVRYVFSELWRFGLKTVPNMITHYKPIDVELESKIKQIGNYFDKNYLNDELYKIRNGSLNKNYWRPIDLDKEQKKNF